LPRVAIQITTLLAVNGHAALWLASLAGIAVGMGLNYIVLDRLVFSSLGWVLTRFDAQQTGVESPGPDRVADVDDSASTTELVDSGGPQRRLRRGHDSTGRAA